MMGDFLVDLNDINIGLDGSLNGIPIPRNQHTIPYSRSDMLSFNNYQLYEQDSPSPRPPLVPPNSLVTNFGPGSSASFSSQMNYYNEQQRGTFSPNNASSPLMMNCNMDMDIEIKMEPLEDLLDISEMISGHNDSSNPPQEDTLLDSVNLEDLLMSDELESTTCLDPQHSSPAAMATVHPDDVLGITRNEAHNSNVSHSFTPSMSVPIKSENFSFGLGGISSFPPLGTGWRDPFLHLSNDNMYQRNVLHQQNIKEVQHSARISQHSGFSQNFSDLVDQHQAFNNNDSLQFSQLESNTPSALHDLLVNSPSNSDPLSPESNTLSPIRNISGNQEISIGQSVPGPSSFLASGSSFISSRLSSSAPVNNFSFEKIWQRREPKQHILSTGSLIGLEEIGGSTSSLSTGGGILSPAPHDLSIDEEIDSEDESDIERYDSDSDDNESVMSEEMSALNNMKKERHFWQYNVQAKGPKGQRVNIIQNEANPYELDKITDPVFSPLCSMQGIKHSGKARRGDGNDLTPSPRKLVSIGIELDKLNKKINEMAPVSEMPTTVRSKSRKEKNKLASRACRLKKKAQHEANKIKLFGLDLEHRGLLRIIAKVRDDLLKKVEFGGRAAAGFDFGSPQNESNQQVQQHLTNQIGKGVRFRLEQRIAGHTTEFVNKVIERCRNGNPTGGLDELAQIFNKATLSSSPDNQDSDLYT